MKLHILIKISIRLRILFQFCNKDFFFFFGIRKTYKGSNVHMFTRIFRILFDMKSIS